MDTVYYDFDTDADLITALDINPKRLPTFIFYDDDENEVERLSGEIDKHVILQLIEKIHGKSG